MENSQYIIHNGECARRLPNYNKLDMELCVSLPQGSGQRNNNQYTIGIAAENIKKTNAGDLINEPQNKKDNVKSGLLPMMAVTSKLLHAADPCFHFHATPLEAESRRKLWASCIMEEDDSLSDEEKRSNVLESLTVSAHRFCSGSKDGRHEVSEAKEGWSLRWWRPI